MHMSLAESRTEAVARRFGLPIADLSRATAQAASLVPERWARRYNVVPLAATEHDLEVATSDPLDVDCEHTLAFATGRHVRFAVADATDIARTLDDLYRSADAPLEQPQVPVDVEHLDDDKESAPPTSEEAGGNATTLVDELLAGGIAARASDIHIEPEEQGIAVRHRVDGVLALARTLPRAIAPALVSRIKILSGLDIADRLRPQDGRARVAVNGTAVDLRVSTLPASHGEKVVIRVLDARATILSLDTMGFHRPELERIERLLQCREGLMLVTGPTGSGKTTTLYAALRRLKERGVNIVTVEDPIEYRLPGIVQVQVNEKAGLTFASALRSIMRQDPDVLLIGEIRDAETAEIAIQASLTGHLVLSTLHTNDAASAVTRLVDIGVARYKIATALKGVLAQRLVRRCCPRCAGQEPVGCRACDQTGFRGRLAIVEVLIASAEFEHAVATGATAERIAEVARANGMGSLWTSGMAHVQAGDTALAEILRVTSSEEPASTLAASAPKLPISVAEPAFSGAAFALRSDIDDLVAHPRAPASLPRMAEFQVGTVDVYAIRPLAEGWRVLVMQRSENTRCPTAWESVHGHIEPGEEPEDAAVRELREETGLAVERLYNVTVQQFYLHKPHVVMLAVVFAAFVADGVDVLTGPEHRAAEWLSVGDALERFHWPRERAALQEILALLSTGDAGPVEDVLRVL